MKKMISIFSVGLLILLLPVALVAEENGGTDKYSLWIGSHYTDFTDYTKSVGEYNLGNNEWLPELGFKYLSQRDNSIYTLYGHYFDKNNVWGKINTRVGDKFTGEFQYRSLVKQMGQDLLVNAEAREWLPPDTGGKILTHEITDPDADYKTHRQEFTGKMSLLVSHKNNVRLIAAHRTILKSGTEQKIASTHCFSCHLTSKTAKVDNRTHQFETGVDATVKKFDVGYRLAYRIFENNAPDASAYWDPAKHPVSGGAASEFASRVIYQDATLPFDTYPKTEKMSHKMKLKGDLGKGYFAGTLNYSKAKNKSTNLATTAWTGAANYTMPINPKTRLIAKIYGARLRSDDPWIDLPTYRDGAIDGNFMDFDYRRYSSQDRIEGRISAEVITRLTPQMKLAILAGYTKIDRYDYPIVGEGTETNKLTAQAKMYYRKGLKYTAFLKYRFESISDPFVSGFGLFEAAGYQNPLLDPLVPTSNWVFYFQREALRYQSVTSQPTQVHKFEWRSTYRPSNKYYVMLGVKGKLDKNNDLDSLDVKHLSIQPHVNFNLMPDPAWVVTAGYSYNFDKSRVPLAVALFDG